MRNEKLLGWLVLVAMCVGMPGCDDDAGSEASAEAADDGEAAPKLDEPGTHGLLLEICEGLVAEGFASKCGTEADLCGEDSGCLQLAGTEPAEVTTDRNSEDPPVDLETLFDRIDFLDEEAKEAITSSGTFTVGEPAAEGEVFVEIDVDRYDYFITSGGVDGGGSSSESPEAQLDGLLTPLGVDQRQVELHAANTGATSSTGETTVLSLGYHIYRVVNGIRVESDRLVINFDLDGTVERINGNWPRIDYANSQFSTSYDSTAELVADVLETFATYNIVANELEDVSLSLSYRVDEANLTLTLYLSILRGISFFEMRL
jgi:hypothetical protein